MAVVPTCTHVLREYPEPLFDRYRANNKELLWLHSDFLRRLKEANGDLSLVVIPRKWKILIVGGDMTTWNPEDVVQLSRLPAEWDGEWYVIYKLRPENPTAASPRYARGARKGAWKANSTAFTVVGFGSVIGSGRLLDFRFEGSGKTSWKMEEFRCTQDSLWVIGRIRKHGDNTVADKPSGEPQNPTPVEVALMLPSGYVKDPPREYSVGRHDVANSLPPSDSHSAIEEQLGEIDWVAGVLQLAEEVPGPPPQAPALLHNHVLAGSELAAMMSRIPTAPLAGGFTILDAIADDFDAEMELP